MTLLGDMFAYGGYPTFEAEGGLSTPTQSRGDILVLGGKVFPAPKSDSFPAVCQLNRGVLTCVPLTEYRESVIPQACVQALADITYDTPQLNAKVSGLDDKVAVIDQLQQRSSSQVKLGAAVASYRSIISKSDFKSPNDRMAELEKILRMARYNDYYLNHFFS